MHVRVVTLRYQESVEGFVEEALTQATAGREVLEVREHFFVYGNVPHLTLVLLTQPPETGPETELGSGSMEGGTRWREGTTDPMRSSPSCARRRSCWPEG